MSIKQDSYSKYTTTLFSNIIKIGEYNISTHNWPAGLIYFPNFIQDEYVDNLYKKIDKLEWVNNALTYGFFPKKGTPVTDVKSYVLTNKPPGYIKCFMDLLSKYKFTVGLSNQVLVNKYSPGNGIVPQHINNLVAIDDNVVILSLGSPVLVLFTSLKNKNNTVTVPLLPGSLLILSGESRYEWKYGILPNKIDEYKIKGLDDQKWSRTDHISIVFRTVKF
jgi:alkylated DNA repair dioxygenase AlkB